MGATDGWIGNFPVSDGSRTWIAILGSHHCLLSKEQAQRSAGNRLSKGFVEIEDAAGNDAQHHSFVDPFGLEGVKPALAHGDTE